MHHRIVIVGGGSAGITVAARLRRAGIDDVAVVEPSSSHWYQPLWTLVGAGIVDVSVTERPESRVMPKGVRWIQDHVAEIDADHGVVTTATGAVVGYDFLVMAPGLQLDWDAVDGLPDAIDRHVAVSNYRPDLAPHTWERLRDLREGTALFTIPSGPIKCGGAGQKIMYLAADHLRRTGRSGAVRVVLASATPSIFGIPEFARVLEEVIARYGIETHFRHDLVAVDAAAGTATFAVGEHGSEGTATFEFDFLHVVPPQSAPDFVKAGPLSAPGDPKGWIDVDRSTLGHDRYPNVFALGDVTNTRNAKTGAAVRKQAPVVVANLRAAMEGRAPDRRYDGYGSCPLTTAYGRLLLAEFDDEGRPHPTIPFIDTARERHDLWYLKRYGLPWLYWNLMLRGLA